MIPTTLPLRGAGLLGRALFALAPALLTSLLVASSSVQAAAPSERYVVELRVIEGEKGDDSGPAVVDKRLSGLAKDLKNLPFKSFQLKDQHTSLVAEGERVSLEIPVLSKKGKDKKRFLVVAAHGRQAGGKLRFSLGIEALKFDTLVAVPEGGTIIVGGPRGEGGSAVLFAFTAKVQK
ncbi:MAG: hypothetical protein Q8O67_24885 [Deltaproteobacteria bacterium]|nr:hypothetical protein [Deltaproteobacteria bacterium]